MKVLLISDGIAPFVLGGMQKHSAYLAKYLTISGCKVSLVHCIYENDHIPTDSEINGILFNGEHILDEILTIQFPKSIYYPGHYIINSYKYSKIVYQKIVDKINEYDFIYVKGFSGWKLLEEKTKGLKTPPTGVNFHGMNMFLPINGTKLKLQQILLRKPVKFNIKSSDYVFSYGGKVTEVIHEIGVPKNCIIEIPTGIEQEWVMKSNSFKTRAEIQFLFVGRYDLVKGIKELNKAIISLNHLNFKFHFIGPFPSEKQIKSEQILYHGHVRDLEDVKTLMDQSDVLVLPSYSEGMPNVILEAMSRGLAIIATNVGANSLMVDEDNGLLIQNTDCQNIQKAMKFFISMDQKILIEKKERSIEKIKKSFLWDKIAIKTRKELESKISQ